jgi:hypothetical protein
MEDTGEMVSQRTYVDGYRVDRLPDLPQDFPAEGLIWEVFAHLTLEGYVSLSPYS